LAEVGSLHASKGKVFSCTFSPDGKWLASAGQDKKVNDSFRSHISFKSDLIYSAKLILVWTSKMIFYAGFSLEYGYFRPR